MLLLYLPLQNKNRWIPGGKGSSSSSNGGSGPATATTTTTRKKKQQRAVMGPVPRDVRAGVLGMVAGKGE